MVTRPEGLPRGDNLDTFVEKMLNDTGFYCRNVLGFHTDSMPELPKGRPRQGGVRAYGNHQKVVALIDDFKKPLANIFCPRNAYKSSIVMGFLARCILRYPDFRALLVMHDLKEAENRVKAVRDHLESNEIVRFLFGEGPAKVFKGPLWKASRFISPLRSRGKDSEKGQGLLDPTLFAAAVGGALPTGTHPDLILFDDIVHRDNVKTAEMQASIIEDVRYFNKLRGGKGVVRNVGTPYTDTDAHQFLLSQPHWERLILPIGLQVMQHDDGRYYLDGPEVDPEWPHLSKRFLEQQLAEGFITFMSQYKLQIVGGEHQAFHRGQFTPVSWSGEMRDLTGYLLTDVATSEKVEGCLNVLIYIGLDKNRRVTILDCEIGRWGVHEFCKRLIEMQERWSSRVNHHGVCFETTAAGNAYRSILMQKSREKKIHVNLLMQRRTGADLAKSERIYGLEGLFHNRHVFVCDTVPRFWNDVNKRKLLWDPEGYVDPTTGEALPDGELVVQFTRFPAYKLKDIPDALAMVNYIDPKTGQHQCFYKKPPGTKVPATVTRRRSRPGVAPGWGTSTGFYERATRNMRG